MNAINCLEYSDVQNNDSKNQIVLPSSPDICPICGKKTVKGAYYCECSDLDCEYCEEYAEEHACQTMIQANIAKINEIDELLKRNNI